MKLWDPLKGVCLQTFAAHENWVRAVLFHPSFKYIISASDDKTVRVLDIKVSLSLAFRSTRSLFFICCVYYLFFCFCTFHFVTCTLPELQEGRCMRTIVDAHSHFVTCLSLSPSYPVLLSGGVDKNISIWNCA